MAHPGVWLVAWLLISPLVLLLVGSAWGGDATYDRRDGAIPPR